MKGKWWKKLLVIVTAATLFLGTGATAMAAVSPVSAKAGEEKTGSDSGSAVADSRYGVVRVLALYSDGYSLGSAFGVGEAGEETNIFVTNHHVVTDENGIESPEIYILLDSRAFGVNSIGVDFDASLAVRCDLIYLQEGGYPDFAVLKARDDVKGRYALPLLNSKEVKPGDDVYAIGYPSNSDISGLDPEKEQFYYVANVDDVYVSKGTVSRHTTVPAWGNTELIQHTAIIDHGNSGGPLITENGAVVGINTYSYLDNNYYSVSIDYIMDTLDDLKISYDIYTEEEPEPDGISPVLIAVIAAVVAAAIAAAVVLLRKKSGDAPRTDNGQNITAKAQNTGMQADTVSKTKPAQETEPTMASDSGLRFQCLEGVFAGKRFALNGAVRIGRDPARNDLVFPADTSGISSVHCILMLQDGQIYLKDLGSTYGTYLAGGQRLAANQAVALKEGDRFYLGSEKECFMITRKGGI